MKKLFRIALASTSALVPALISLGCSSLPAATSTPPAITSPAVPITTPPPASPAVIPHQQIAEDFIKNNSTFKYDGIDGSLKLVNTEEYGPTCSFRSSVFTYEFQTAHPGYGDRSGQTLAQVITTHTADIYVDIDSDRVKIATCDRTWDMIKDRELPVYVSGVILGGGDTTPADGPLDAPRQFVYQVQKDNGTLINVSYTAYPPSPVGDANRAKITLDFYSGTINIGDKIQALGSLDKETNTIVVANQGDYIKTLPPET